VSSQFSQAVSLSGTVPRSRCGEEVCDVHRGLASSNVGHATATNIPSRRLYTGNVPSSFDFLRPSEDRAAGRSSLDRIGPLNATTAARSGCEPFTPSSVTKSFAARRAALRPASTSSSAPTPDEFRCAAFRGKHPAQKKQIARLRCFRIDAERLRRRREIEAKFFQPLLSAGKPRAFARYHLPACAPPSTCSISPVVNVASVRNKTASTISLTSPSLLNGLSPLRGS
jgi:hypothetical protein